MPKYHVVRSELWDVEVAVEGKSETDALRVADAFLAVSHPFAYSYGGMGHVKKIADWHGLPLFYRAERSDPAVSGYEVKSFRSKETHSFSGNHIKLPGPSKEISPEDASLSTWMEEVSMGRTLLGFSSWLDDNSETIQIDFDLVRDLHKSRTLTKSVVVNLDL